MTSIQDNDDEDLEISDNPAEKKKLFINCE